MNDDAVIVQPRRRTRQVRYGSVAVGGEAPVSIQSMGTRAASERDGVRCEVEALHRAGCDIFRVTVKDDRDIAALPALCSESPMPIIADVHFDFELAVKSAAAGVAGLRINPGNIGGGERVRRVVEAAGAAQIPLRVGVNAGSIERDLRGLLQQQPARALIESASRCRVMIEQMGFQDLVFSIKSSDPLITVEANRLFAADNDYPLHIGVTESGPAVSGTARSAVALTLLLAAGIGDTVRVSLSGDPVREVLVAAAILTSLDLREDFPRVISCPTCGRCWIDVVALAERVERELIGVRKPITVAVMGCEVNGPGEAREADIGLAGTREGAVLFQDGEVTKRLEGNFLEEFVAEVRRLALKD